MKQINLKKLVLLNLPYLFAAQLSKWARPCLLIKSC